MRLLRVWIDGYRNLKDVTVDFDKDSLTTVVIGENGSGKSNLIEAIVEVFRAWDLGVQQDIKFNYMIYYRIGDVEVELFFDENLGRGFSVSENSHHGVGSRRIEPEFLPDLILGYYS